MEEMVLGTCKYVSTRRASKITGYAQDYVGQLVRTGKVKATKVGKSWFVLEDDVLKLSGKAAALQSPERALAVLEKKNLTVTKSVVSVSVEYPKTWSNVQYFREDEPLLPISDKREVIGYKPSIELLDSHTVKISGSAETHRTGNPRARIVTAHPNGTTVGATPSVVQMSSFDGVRYSAAPLVQVTTDTEAEEVFEEQEAPVLLSGNRSYSDFGFGWLVRLVVSALIVSIFGLLVPIF